MIDSLPAVARAAVYDAPNQPLRVADFPLPTLLPGQAIARILCTTICGSDLHTYYGRRHSPAPSVLGHEMVGVIAAVGPGGVEEFEGPLLSVGDRVTWSMVWSCGACFYCTHGLRPKCERLLKFGHEALRPGFDPLGGFADYCFLPAGTAICRVPANVPDLAASPANCATATVAAVYRHAGSLQQASVVVYGAGMLGLTACAMARWLGAAEVLAIDTDESRRAIAPRFGASRVLDGRLPPEELKRQVREATAGRGADVLLEFTGNSDAMEAGFDLLRFGGRYLLAGATFPSRPLALPGEQIVRRMLRLEGVYNYEPQDLQRALRFLSECAGQFPFTSLVGKTFPLDRIQEAFTYAETQRPPRVALLPL